MSHFSAPDCVTCLHFLLTPRSDTPTINVRSPDADCQCLKYRVHLPMQETSKLLVCAQWSDYRGSNYNEGWSKDLKTKLNGGTLYGYTGEQTFDTQKYADIDALLSLD